MKKISAVLLVLVLVGSVAFAGFTGSVETSFGFDLDNTDVGFENANKAVLDFVLFEELGQAKGDGDVYAEIKARFLFWFDEVDFVANPTTPVGDVKFDYARIVAGDWSVGILGTADGPNYASSAVDTYSADHVAVPVLWEKDDAVDAVRKIDKVGPGVQIGYSGYVLSFGMPYGGGDNNLDNKDYKIYTALSTPGVELGDGLEVAFGAAALFDSAATDNVIGASVKADYAMDDLTVTVASDIQLVGDDFDAEVSVAAAYDIVDVDVYFATKAQLGDGSITDIAVENLLSVKAHTVIDAFDVTVTGKDLVNKQALGVSVDWAASNEIALNVNGGYTIDTKDYYGGAGVTYKADEFTAKAKAKYSNNIDVDNAGLSAEVSVDSSVVVDGANVYAKWVADDLLNSKIGKITVGAKISF
ncbi:MAG: hypothetical protein ACOXZ4_07995 [Sphaerochaetaceae bacterium]